MRTSSHVTNFVCRSAKNIPRFLAKNAASGAFVWVHFCFAVRRLSLFLESRDASSASDSFSRFLALYKIVCMYASAARITHHPAARQILRPQCARTHSQTGHTFAGLLGQL